jgi:membrane protease YdiL (CAAX protease family)
MNSLLLYLPLEFKELTFINAEWNWTGKIFAISGSFIFLLLYKQFDLKDYFLTLNQNKGFIKKGALIVALILLVKSMISFYFGSTVKGNIETILFQLTMPGIDEEIAYRGIMLGLLVNVLKPFRETIFHPAILVTAILFGLGHGLFMTKSFELSFDIFSFLSSCILGIIWGWLTIKSGSIVLSLTSHNLGNLPINFFR